MSKAGERNGKKPASCTPEYAIAKTVPPDQSLPRSARISASADFRAVFDSGPGFPARTLVLWFKKKEGARLRLGVVASKRTLRRAVDRSRAKRLLREAFRLNRHRFQGGADVVLLARGRIRSARCPDVERDLLQVAQKSGLTTVEPQAGSRSEKKGEQ